jgi:hypothetical protein
VSESDKLYFVIVIKLGTAARFCGYILMDSLERASIVLTILFNAFLPLSQCSCVGPISSQLIMPTIALECGYQAQDITPASRRLTLSKTHFHGSQLFVPVWRRKIILAGEIVRVSIVIHFNFLSVSAKFSHCLVP